MITYLKGMGGFPLLRRLYGSAWPRALVLSVPSVTLAVILEAFAHKELRKVILHPMPFTVFGGIVAFVILFRTNLSYARYWEGCTMVTQLSSKWADATIQVVSFDEASVGSAAARGVLFRAEFVHMMSLMHALAMQRLRGDRDLDNLVMGSFVEDPPEPPVEAANIPGWEAHHEFKSYIALQTGPSYFSKLWKVQPLPVLGGLSATEIEIVQRTRDRVYLIFCWVHRALVQRRMEGGIKEDAPIVARIYQSLSDGMLGFENALKICNVPFPFPYAQAVTVLLYIFSILVPFVMAAWLSTPWLPSILTLCSVASSFMLNEVAREIEEPFKYDPNDVPCRLLHHRFNSRLVTAFCRSIPPEGGLQDQINLSQIKSLINIYRPQRSQPPSPISRKRSTSLDSRIPWAISTLKESISMERLAMADDDSDGIP